MNFAFPKLSLLVVFFIAFVVEAPVEAAVIGVDWGGSAPTNWNVGTGGGNPQSLSDLVDESGATTTVDVSYNGTGFSNTSTQPFTANAGQIPSHTNSLTNISGGLNDADEIDITFSDLAPGTQYRVWVFGAQNEGASTFHDVTITGQGPAIAFNQTFSGAAGELWVNGSVGSNAALETFAAIATATAGGTLQINVNDDGGAGNTAPVVTLAGIAIEQVISVPEPATATLAMLGLGGLLMRRSCRDLLPNS